MKLGLVGPGRHGKRYLERRNGGDHVVTFCRRSDSLGEMLAKVDGVIVATPPDTHRDIVVRALHAGKDVLCEKPLALTFDDCKAMLDAAEQAGRRLVVAHQHLWADGFARHLGKPITHIGSVSGGPNGHDYSAWLDWGSHDVAMAIAAFGRAPTSARRDRMRDLCWCGMTFGDETADILTGILPTRARLFDAGSWSYDGRFAEGREPMRLMVEAFVSGQSDWQTSNEFNRAVCGVLFGEVIA